LFIAILQLVVRTFDPPKGAEQFSHDADGWRNQAVAVEKVFLGNFNSEIRS
jgi:hypothetical protein